MQRRVGLRGARVSASDWLAAKLAERPKSWLQQQFGSKKSVSVYVALCACLTLLGELASPP